MGGSVKFSEQIGPGLLQFKTEFPRVHTILTVLILCLASTNPCKMTDTAKKSPRKSQERVFGGKYLLMFRKIVRKVILKKFWQGIFDANLSLDQIRNTQHIFRPIGQNELLFQQERRILTIPFHERDAIQRKIAELIITQLKCMARFEPQLRRKLSACLRYVEYCKGRTVIKVSRMTW